MSHLVPCPECNRHVRVTETACPFCALPLDLSASPEPQLPNHSRVLDVASRMAAIYASRSA